MCSNDVLGYYFYYIFLFKYICKIIYFRPVWRDFGFGDQGQNGWNTSRKFSPKHAGSAILCIGFQII